MRLVLDRNILFSALILACFRRLAAICALLCFACLEAQGADPRNEAMLSVWKESSHSSVLEYEEYLKSKNVYSVFPMHQLLRTASDWESCGGYPFEVPPRSAWAGMAKTLELVKLLRERQLFPHGEVVSAFRNNQLNKCAKGSPESTHVIGNALDIWPGSPSDTKTDMSRLCDFWHNEGKKYSMGLSLYPSGRIHIDTNGYRTWGHDGHYGTSACLKI